MELLRPGCVLIDKLQLSGFMVSYVDDARKLEEEGYLFGYVEDDMEEGFTCSTGSYKKIKLPQCDYFDYFEYKLTDDYKVIARMDMSPRDEYHNLNCYTWEEYSERLQEIRLYLAEEYGILVDFENVRVKSVEVCCTIQLDAPFNEYHYPLEQIMCALPAGLRMGDLCRYDTVSEKKLEREVNYLMRSSGKRGMAVKLYNKTQQLKDRHGVTLDNNYLRFELDLSSAKVCSVFGTTMFSSITQTQIESFFREWVEKNLVEAQNNYQKRQKKVLGRIVRRNCDVKIKDWLDNTMIEVYEEQRKRNLSIILEMDEVWNVIANLPYGNRMQKTRAKRKLEELCKSRYTSFCNHDGDKLVEILDKISGVNTQYDNSTKTTAEINANTIETIDTTDFDSNLGCNTFQLQNVSGGYAQNDYGTHDSTVIDGDDIPNLPQDACEIPKGQHVPYRLPLVVSTNGGPFERVADTRVEAYRPIFKRECMDEIWLEFFENCIEEYLDIMYQEYEERCMHALMRDDENEMLF